MIYLIYKIASALKQMKAHCLKKLQQYVHVTPHNHLPIDCIPNLSVETLSFKIYDLYYFKL